MIEISNIHKYYHIGQETYHALNDISLSIQAGEFVSIMGASGSGKSTLMNGLGLLDTFSEGTYILNNKDVSGLNENERAQIRNQEIGFVFQSFNLIPRMSLLENVALPLVYAGVSRRDRLERAQKALESVGLGDKLSNKTNEISGGQMQRVAIARAVINEPAVLMADEPTGNLDSTTTLEIIRIFQELNQKGTTIVMVTHEPEVAEHTQRIVRLKDGQIISDQANKQILLESGGDR